MAEIKFTSKEREEFYTLMIQKSGHSDSYHRAFFYCIGISDTTRRNVGRIFDFEQDRIKPEGLHEGWHTRGTVRIIRLAFNLWNGYIEQGKERMSTPYLENMEGQFGKAIWELKEVRGQLTQMNGNLHRENERLTKINEKLEGENENLRAENKDYKLLTKAFSSKQMNSLLEQAKAVQQSKQSGKHFRSNKEER